MKVYYLVMVSALCVWNNPVQSQWFYSHYTQFAPQPLPYTHFIPQPPTYNFAPPPQVRQPPPPATGDYRGFGYHTSFQDGASSTVYFVTGPEAVSNFRRTFGKAETPRARNLASDITDSNAIPDINAHLQSILQPTEFQQLFDSRSVGVVNFYYPADTVPLPQINNGTTELTSFTTAASTTPTSEEATTIANTPETEAEPAESIVENTRFRFNVIEDSSSSTTVSATTTTTTTTTTSTTEAAATTETSTETTETPENTETTTVVESTTVV